MLFALDVIYNKFLKQQQNAINAWHLNEWCGKYVYYLFVAVLLLGPLVDGFNIFQTFLFNLQIFSLDLTLEQKLIIETYYTVLSIGIENIPQMIIQCFVSFDEERIENDEIFLISLCFNLVSMVSTIFSLIIKRRVRKNLTINQSDTNDYAELRDSDL